MILLLVGIHSAGALQRFRLLSVKMCRHAVCIGPMRGPSCLLKAFGLLFCVALRPQCLIGAAAGFISAASVGFITLSSYGIVSSIQKRFIGQSCVFPFRSNRKLSTPCSAISSCSVRFTRENASRSSIRLPWKYQGTYSRGTKPPLRYHRAAISTWWVCSAMSAEVATFSYTGLCGLHTSYSGRWIAFSFCIPAMTNSLQSSSWMTSSIRAALQW